MGMRNEKKAEAAQHLKRFRAWQKDQLALLQARRAAGLPDPEPAVSYETEPDPDETPEGDDDHIHSSVYDYEEKDMFADAKAATLGTSRPALKDRLAAHKAAEAEKRFAEAVATEKHKKDAAAAASTDTSSTQSCEWTEDTQMRLAALVRNKKFDFEAVAKCLAEEMKWTNLTADACRLKWCSLDWAKYKNKSGLERPSSSQKSPAEKGIAAPKAESANKIPQEATVTESEPDPVETAQPPVPPPTSTASVGEEADLLCFEETDMDELD